MLRKLGKSVFDKLVITSGPQQKKTFLRKKRTILSQLLSSSYFSLLRIMVIWGLILKCGFGFGFSFSPYKEERSQHVETLISCAFLAPGVLVKKETQ